MDVQTRTDNVAWLLKRREEFAAAMKKRVR